jgi:hypothetical protein
VSLDRYSNRVAGGRKSPTDHVVKNDEIGARPGKNGLIVSDPRQLLSHTSGLQLQMDQPTFGKWCPGSSTDRAISRIKPPHFAPFPEGSHRWEFLPTAAPSVVKGGIGSQRTISCAVQLGEDVFDDMSFFYAG